ncbi:MAG TPA: hypothetical protein VHG08_11885 [Longimicrobium sp.]|nr:hypothetical protein [Longimicrobium sp.]
MVTNLDRAGVVARNVQLESVAMRSASVHSAVDPLAQPPVLRVEQGYRAGYELPELHPDHLVVRVEFQLSAAPQEGTDGDADVVTLHAEFLLVYALPDAGAQPADALEHFAELNGPYNAWPYWRELVQTVTGRVGLSAIVVPVFRPPVRKLDVEVPEPTPAPRSRPRAPRKKAAS